MPVLSATIRIFNGNPYVYVSARRARTIKPDWRQPLPSRKKEILRYFSWLKSPEAKARNVARALQVLSGKGGRFMARSW